MRSFVAGIVAVLSLVPGSASDNCGGSSKEDGGNWYCQEVSAIKYTKVGHSGIYNDVVAMNGDGTCTSVPKAYSGPMAPLDEEVSAHFRGPVQILQFAAYTMQPVKDIMKRDVGVKYIPHSHQSMHVRRRGSKKKSTVEERDQSYVTATIDGQAVSWVNNYFGPNVTPHPVVPVPVPNMITAIIDGQVVSWPNPVVPTTATAASAPHTNTAASNTPVAIVPEKVHPASKTTIHSATTADPDHTVSGDYTRIGYYNATSGHVDGLTFLGNHGGDHSGTFDLNFGMSLSYLNGSGTGGASSATVLQNIMVPSNQEVIIMTDKACNNGDCGYTRPGGVAYHGFDGADKVFMFEILMPLDGNRGFNGDRPAAWLLNANIPRTLQYGNPECSCWASGCGEFDIMEVLGSGDLRCKSTLYTSANHAGDSGMHYVNNYFTRPISTPVKIAVVFSHASSTIHVLTLDPEFDFCPSFTAEKINELCAAYTGDKISEFALADK